LNPKLFKKSVIPTPLISKDEVIAHVRNTVLSSWTTILATLSAMASEEINMEFKRRISISTDNKLMVKELTNPLKIPHKRTISVNDSDNVEISPMGLQKPRGFAGTHLFIESMDDELINSFAKIIIKTSDQCHNCSLNLTDTEIRSGWSSNPNDYRTTCPRCQVKFVASFTIGVLGEKEEKSYYYLSHAILTKEITNLLKKDVIADVQLFLDHPIIFWNIIIHLRDLQIPLNFLLPRYCDFLKF
jgi:hypothetical protein